MNCSINKASSFGVSLDVEFTHRCVFTLVIKKPFCGWSNLFELYVSTGKKVKLITLTVTWACGGYCTLENTSLHIMAKKRERQWPTLTKCNPCFNTSASSSVTAVSNLETECVWQGPSSPVLTEGVRRRLLAANRKLKYLRHTNYPRQNLPAMFEKAWCLFAWRTGHIRRCPTRRELKARSRNINCCLGKVSVACMTLFTLVHGDASGGRWGFRKSKNPRDAVLHDVISATPPFHGD